MNKNCDKYIRPFRFQLLQSFPYIVEDFDQYTEYQLFCKLVEKVNEVVGNENEITKEVNDIKEYLETLDLQDEVNEKLDEMAESGELQEIIATYLNANALLCFDNVQSMQNATNLIDGSFAKTLGYYSKNDGGGATYKISSSEPTNYHLQLNNNLYAELVTNKTLNLLKIGLKENDNTFDNSLIFDNIVANYFLQTKLYIPKGNFYFKRRIKLNYINLEMDPQTQLILNSDSIIDCFVEIGGTDELGYYFGNKIIGGIINCNEKAKTGIGINNSRTFELSTRVYNFNEVGLNTAFKTKTQTMFSCAEGFIHNCLFLNENEKLNTIAIKDNGNDNQFDNIIVQDVVIGVELGPGSSLHSLHHWISRTGLFNTSTSLQLRGGSNIISDLIVDTIATAVEFLADYLKATISGLNYYLNSSVINNEYLVSNTPSVFKLKTQNSLLVSNSMLNFNGGTFKLFDDTSYTNYNITHFDTLRFVNFENSFFISSSNVSNILSNPINSYPGLNSIKGKYIPNTLTRDTDFDTITETGIYSINTYDAGSGEAGNNTPLSNTNFGGNMLVIGGKTFVIQFVVANTIARIIVRVKFSNTWGKWHDYTGTFES